MSSSNTVAIVTVIVSALSTGYAAYVTNQTARESERVKQEYMVELEKLRSAQQEASEIRKYKMKLRDKYCSEASAIFKELTGAIVKSRSVIPSVEKSEALKLEALLSMQALAYLDKDIQDAHSRKYDNAGGGGMVTVSALAMQVSDCSGISIEK